MSAYSRITPSSDFSPQHDWYTYIHTTKKTWHWLYTYIHTTKKTWHWLYLLLSTLQLRDDEHLDSRLYAFRTCTSFELYWRLRRPHDICEFLTSFSDFPECKSPRLLKLKWNQAASSQLLYNSEYLCAKCQFLSVFDDFLHCPTYLL